MQYCALGLSTDRPRAFFWVKENHLPRRCASGKPIVKGPLVKGGWQKSALRNRFLTGGFLFWESLHRFAVPLPLTREAFVQSVAKYYFVHKKLVDYPPPGMLSYYQKQDDIPSTEY